MGTIACPACTAPAAIEPGSKVVDCLYCGRQFVIHGELCPACGYINPEGSERCARCSEPLSLVDQVFSRHEGIASPQWLKRARNQAGMIKQDEGAASWRRMRTFEEREKERRTTLERQIAERRLQDRRLLTVGLIGAIAIIVTVLALAVALR
jgi:hypothetical protein